MGGPHIVTLMQGLTTPRRSTVKTLLGGAFGALLAGHTWEEASAGCKKVGKKCDRDNDCCNGAKCQNDKCKCKIGFNKCNGKCFDLDSDEDHCGDCDASCGGGESCCDGACANLQTSRDNCGACGVACTNDEICFEGICVPCPVGNAVCGDICCAPFRACCDGTCVNELESNPDHCGECGNRCPGICTEGPNGAQQCHGPRCCSSGQCVDDVQSNPDHCGACDNACAPGESCCDGVCGGACGNTFCRCDETRCDGECADLEFDDDHCGRCEVQCAPGQVCQEGRCKDETPGN